MTANIETAKHILDNFNITRGMAYNRATQVLSIHEIFIIDVKSYQNLPGIKYNLYDFAHQGKLTHGETGMVEAISNLFDDNDKRLVLQRSLSFDDYRIYLNADVVREIAGVSKEAAGKTR